MFEVVADFIIVVYTPVAFVEKEKAFFYGVLFNVRSVLKKDGCNAPAYVCIEGIIAGKDGNAFLLTFLSYFEKGVTAFYPAGFGFLVGCNNNSVIVRKNCNGFSA